MVSIYGRGDASAEGYVGGDGWWVIDKGVEKFFVKSRFLEIKPCVE